MKPRTFRTRKEHGKSVVYPIFQHKGEPFSLKVGKVKSRNKHEWDYVGRIPQGEVSFCRLCGNYRVQTGKGYISISHKEFQNRRLPENIGKALKEKSLGFYRVDGRDNIGIDGTKIEYLTDGKISGVIARTFLMREGESDNLIEIFNRKFYLTLRDNGQTLFIEDQDSKRKWNLPWGNTTRFALARLTKDPSEKYQSEKRWKRRTLLRALINEVLIPLKKKGEFKVLDDYENSWIKGENLYGSRVHGASGYLTKTEPIILHRVRYDYIGEFPSISKAQSKFEEWKRKENDYTNLPRFRALYRFQDGKVKLYLGNTKAVITT